jgi:hypothetical protein
MIKRLLMLLLLCALPTLAQTTVSGQVTDTPDSQAWNNGSYVISLVPAGGALSATFSSSGSPATVTYSGNLTATGSYSQSGVTPNASITSTPPGVGSVYNFKFCPQAAPAQCFSVLGVTVSGATQTVNATPPSIRIQLPSSVPVSAYTTTEVVGATIGSTFYNLTSAGTFVCSALPCSGANWLSAGAGSATLAGNQGAIYASPACPTPYVSGTCYPVLADSHWIQDGTVSSGSGTVTAPDMNATGTDYLGRPIAKVGQICFGTSLFLNGTLDIAQGTISSINSGTSITCSTTNTSATRTATEVFVWGDDDTAALNTFWAAAISAGAAGHLPNGGMMVQSKVFQTPDSTNGNNQAVALYGETDTYIIGTPNFSFTGVGIAGRVGAFWTHLNTHNQLPNIDVMRDVTFWCGGNSSFGTGVTGALWYMQRIIMYNVTGWGCGNGISTLTGLDIEGPSTVIAGNFDDVGGIICNVSSATQNATVNFTGTGYCVGGQTSLQISGGSTVNSWGNFYGPSSSNAIKLNSSGDTFNSFADIINPETTVGIDNTGTTNLYGTQLYNTSVQLTFGMVYARAGSKNFFQGSSFIAPAGSIGLGGAGLTGTHTDGGANTFVNSSICPASSCTLFGTASITGVTQTAGNWSTPAGSGAGQWGTSPSVACPGTLETAAGSSNFEACTITVGSGTVGANPVLTVTWPKAFFVAPNCRATMTGGTAALATFTTGTITTTTGVFTYTGTPGASTTIGLQIQCGNG